MTCNEFLCQRSESGIKWARLSFDPGGKFSWGVVGGGVSSFLALPSGLASAINSVQFVSQKKKKTPHPS
jgi:hypothetical protein